MKTNELEKEEAMKPTLKLAWRSTYGNREELPTVRVEYEAGDQYHAHLARLDYALCQWWEDESGNGEWREIETEA